MLNDKTILILGAGGLLGSCLTNECLKHGANVIAADINIESTRNRLASLGIHDKEKRIQILSLDITNEGNMKNFFSSLGYIDGAVNVTYPRNKEYGAHFFDVTMSSFNENVSLHLGSSFIFSQQCALYFKKNQTPLSVVNISSIYGVVAPKFEIYNDTKMTMAVEYAAIKSALLHLNKYIVRYVNDSRFRINAVSPGGIFDNQPEAFLKAYMSNTNGKGMLDVKDVTGTILFCLSDDSKYVTAQNIIVDDGFHL